MDKDGSATLYITPERIFIQSSEDVEIGGGMDAKGVLIRNDKDDMLIFKGNNKAMKLSKSSIISFMKMAAGFAAQNNKNEDDNPDFSYKKTGKTKMIDGYKSYQFIFTDKSETNQHSVLWMTKSLNINWGLLADIAVQAKQSFSSAKGLPTDIILKEGYFPVLGKQYENGKLDKVFKFDITTTNKAKSHVNVPANVQVMGLRQFMMQKMQRMQQNGSD